MDKRGRLCWNGITEVFSGVVPDWSFRVHVCSSFFSCVVCRLLTSCAMTAIGAASPEQVTKDMIAEVAEQDKLLLQVEDAMRTEHPVQEVSRYRRLGARFFKTRSVYPPRSPHSHH